jgi:acylphosphatase
MAAASTTLRRRILVSGRVQGVGYRYATVREARRLGLRGYARNLPDGRVEVVAEGPPDDVERLTAWCRRGPSAAEVSAVEHVDLDRGSKSLEPFDVRW